MNDVFVGERAPAPGVPAVSTLRHVRLTMSLEKAPASDAASVPRTEANRCQRGKRQQSPAREQSGEQATSKFRHLRDGTATLATPRLTIYPIRPTTEGIVSLRIGIDGFNFAVPHGPGVATYGHALSETPSTGVLRASMPFLSARADPIDEAALNRALNDRTMPIFARCRNAGNLFALAHRHLAYYRRFLSLQMSDPPAIMHWTYPLPVRLAGSLNVFTFNDLVRCIGEKIIGKVPQ